MKIIFELQPTLIGDLIELRPLYHDDFEKLYLCASDPLIWEQHPQSNRYQREIFRKFFDSASASGGAFVVLSKKSGEIIGSTRFYDFKPEEKQIAIGYTFLKRSFWGGSYNSEMKNLMLKHAFKTVDLVLFEIGEHNLRSQRAIEKLGAILLFKNFLDEKTHFVYGIEKQSVGS